jgi:hypothetical protein
MTGTQPAPSAALLKIMGGTLTQPSFATLVEVITNKQSACHMTSKYAVTRVGGSAARAIAWWREHPCVTVTTAEWITKGTDISPRVESNMAEIGGHEKVTAQNSSISSRG